MKKIVITGGHHSSALPVITELRSRYPDIEIFWFGHRFSASGDKNDTLEYREIRALKIPFYNLQAGKFYKTFNPIRLIKIFVGLAHSFLLLLKIRPDIILSFGGYLAVPTVISGKILGIKSVTHEQTIVAGYANKVIAYFADKILVSWPGSKKYFSEEKVVETGLPLRDEIFTSKSNCFQFENNLSVIYITGGKLGSHNINKLVGESLEVLLSKYNIIHQTGDNSVYKDYDALTEKYENLKKSGKNLSGKYYLLKFVFADCIGEAYSKSSLVLSRSGAHTCSEIMALNKKAVLIPIPWVSHNEQNLNAEYVKSMGLCEILSEKEMTSDTLISVIDKVINGKYYAKEKFENKNAAINIINELVSVSINEKSEKTTKS